MNLIKALLISMLLLYGLNTMQAQNVSIKSNLLYDVTGTINLGTEFGIGTKWTLDISGNLNPWTYNVKTNTKIKHLMVQPELRYWLHERFAGHFFGVHAHWMNFNAGALDLPFGITKNNLANYRYRGDLYGAGVSYGYQWFFRSRWAIEAELGLGYSYMKYKKYRCENCGKYQGEFKNNYVGPTKAAVSLIYFIK